MRSTRGSEDTIFTAKHSESAHSPAGEWAAIIVNYNGDPFLDACLAAIGRLRLRPSQVYVVDNASTDDSMRELHAYPWAEALPQRRNLGFSGGANAGLERVETSIAVILNPDVELDPSFGHAVTAAFAENPELGIAGSLLLYPDGDTIQHAGGVITGPTMSTDHRGRGQPLSAEFEQELPIEFATGAAIGLRMAAVEEIGGWDTRFAPAYYEDVDIAQRMRNAGWEVKLIPSMRGLHHEGATLGHSPDYFVYLHRNRIRYALLHLSEDDWNRRFLPAEFSRLRGQLAALDRHMPPQVVGVEAIDMLLRQLDPLAGLGESLPFPLAPNVPAPGIDDLHATRDVRGRPLGSRIPLVGTLRNIFNSIGPRHYVDRALADQRAFNDAVVRALEEQHAFNAAQDRLNRERLAGTLLLALILLERMQRIGNQDSGSEGEST